MSDLVGRTLGAYRLEIMIGRGTLADVYRGAHVFRAQRVAVKVIHPTLTSLPDFEMRFRAALTPIAPLHHPNVIRLIQFDTQEQFFYIVTELTTAGSVDQLLNRSSQGGALDSDLALELAAQTVAGMAYAHAATIVHGNLKPANLLLDQVLMSKLPGGDGETRNRFELKVDDLGMTQLTGGSGALTSVGVPLGTGVMSGSPLYMSPEQCLGKPADLRSDVYALGLIMYELLTGKLPFRTSSLMEAIRAHVKTVPQSPRSLNPGIPIGVEEIILQCLAKDPGERFASAGDLMSALQAAVRTS